jgi:uncharacterized membrane protein YbhN (UPF0104 family)
MALASAPIRSRTRCEQERDSAPLGGAARTTRAMPASEPPADLALPTLDLRGLARRAAAPAALAAAAALAVVLAGGRLRAFADALGRALDADPKWVIAGAAFELLSFGGYVALLWLVGSRATRRLDFRASAQVTLGGAAATRLLPTGGLGGAALTIWAFRRTGLGARGATRTLLTFLVTLYSVFLGAIALSGGAIALGVAHADGPLALSAIPAAVATAGILAGLALGARARRRDSDASVPAADGAAESAGGRLAAVRAALRETPEAIGQGVRDALALVRSLDPRLLGALAWWGFDAAVLWAMLDAFGAPPSLAVVVLAYFVGQVANTLPLPGAVAGGMVGVLLAFGVQADLALASVLAYRAIAIWLPAPIGLATLGGLRRTIARWGDEDPPNASKRERNGAAPATAWPLPVRPEPAVQVAA